MFPIICKKITIFAKIIRLLDSTVSSFLQTLSGQIEVLASQRDAARAALDRTREEMADLKFQLARTREELHKAKLDVEFLTLSRKLADSPDALVDARITVKRMLAKVDKALALLKEDARI